MITQTLNTFSTSGWTAPPLSASSVLTGSVINPPDIPTVYTSYISTYNPLEPLAPNFFLLPIAAEIGTSFRIIGSNPNGWFISSQAANQYIKLGDQISALGFAMIVGPIASEMDFGGTILCGTCMELVYTFLDFSGNECWTVVNAVGNIDLNATIP